MSETTAARCLEAWRACVAALIEVGRLADPVAQKKKAAPKAKPTPAAKPAATETTATPPAAEPIRKRSARYQVDAKGAGFWPAFFGVRHA
jgi:hypothetical protein